MTEILDLKIKAGSTFKMGLTIKDTDITGYDFRMQFRRTVDTDTAALEATIANGKFVITETADVDGHGKVSLIIADTETVDLFSQYVYDIEMESAAGEVTPVIEGMVNITKEVTRD